MSKTCHVGVIVGTEIHEATIEYGPEEHHYRLELQLDDGRVLRADKGDYFESLVALRRMIEPEDARILCQGARRDVWPSGMARDMAGGLRAYVLVKGRRPTSEHLVEIFDPAEPSLVGTIADQERTRDEWLASRGT